MRGTTFIDRKQRGWKCNCTEAEDISLGIVSDSSTTLFGHGLITNDNVTLPVISRSSARISFATAGRAKAFN